MFASFLGGGGGGGGGGGAKVALALEGLRLIACAVSRRSERYSIYSVVT